MVDLRVTMNERLVGFRTSHPKMCLWYVDYFELKAVLASGARESSCPPFNYLGELELGAWWVIRDYQR